MQCERCTQKHDGSYGSGRFCSAKCARAFSTLAVREEINQRLRKPVSIDLVLLRNVLPVSKSWTELARHFGIAGHGDRVRILRTAMETVGLDVAEATHHFRYGRTAQAILRPGKAKRGPLKRALLAVGRPYVCEECGIGPKWNGRDLALPIDHKNGDRDDHREENLRFLCPNCHSQTPTFAGRNINRK